MRQFHGQRVPHRQSAQGHVERKARMQGRRESIKTSKLPILRRARAGLTTKVVELPEVIAAESESLARRKGHQSEHRTGGQCPGLVRDSSHAAVQHRGVDDQAVVLVVLWHTKRPTASSLRTLEAQVGGASDRARTPVARAGSSASGASLVLVAGAAALPKRL